MKKYANLLKNREDFHICSNSYTKEFTEDEVCYFFFTFSENSKVSFHVKENVKVYLFEYVCFESDDCKAEYDIVCEKNSSVQMISIYLGKNSNVSFKTKLYENANSNSMKLSLIENECTFDSDCQLLGKKANDEQYNVIVNSLNCVQNFNLNVSHKEKETTSIMRNFAICKNDSIININTSGLVVRLSKNSNISQKTKGILLSKNSGISANPILLIDEYDCLASHGAGIGAIDEEDLFYLMSRGLSRANSEKLIINGFVNPVYENVREETIKKSIEELFARYL